MNYHELKNLYSEKGEFTYDELQTIISEESFLTAGQMGLYYAKSEGWESFEDAPFCIEKVAATDVSVVVSNKVKSLIEKMKSEAKSQSGDGGNYEASFCMHGHLHGGKILITDAFWDESGYGPNFWKYIDPDMLDYGHVRIPSPNESYTSKLYDAKVKEVCDSAEPDGSLVVIYGHTHPHTKEFKKINNYPSRTDIVLSVEEAVTRHVRENGNICTFLNAIINASGDLNIFGYDVESGKFFILDDVKYENGEKIASYTDGNYPIQAGPTGPNFN